MQDQINNDIITYYNTCENSYKDACHLEECQAMHLGIWDNGIKNLKQALFRENQKLAELGTIKSTDYVLDAGCGVGGSSIWLAKNIGCKATGITIVDSQVQKATQYAQKFSVSEKVNFLKADFIKMPFENNTFDIVWAINSVCYANPKTDFIAEAYRVLKPGGRLLLSDSFQGKEILTDSEKILLYNKTYNGWIVDHLATPDQFLNDMKKIGFKSQSYVDNSNITMKSVKRLYYWFFPAALYNFFSKFMGKKFTKIQLENTNMIPHLYQSFKKGLWQYGMIVGVK